MVVWWCASVVSGVSLCGGVFVAFVGGSYLVSACFDGVVPKLFVASGEAWRADSGLFVRSLASVGLSVCGFGKGSGGRVYHLRFWRGLCGSRRVENNNF